MVVSIRKWFGRTIFMIIFILLTMMTLGGYRWLMDVVAPVDPYREPQGQALKVSGQMQSPEGGSMSDRLRWFYWYGE
ncbi:DUF4227 family protein [Paenibacillus sp. MMS18-CY102]|uniref:DUF4227 family protein n=1 Tax=Paenibacillus sp. MMS18-CY102 TaxID=2682849 RepID=UPI0013652EAD|nr:DUF4227 family protein [Paenibacillus sp. MMS18-CY102]MWC28395.1 DUF4227 family protein [Paenibacillus sp. MMS18-CY102]